VIARKEFEKVCSLDCADKKLLYFPNGEVTKEDVKKRGLRGGQN